MIALDYPEDVVAAVEGVEKFIRKEVFPLHEKYEELLHDDRKKYNEHGVLCAEVEKILRDLRMKSAAAGFFTMCLPESMGGGGLGALAYFAAYERLFHLCGTKYWTAQQTLSHWVRGPSAVLKRLSGEMRERVLPRFMSGELTLCFALSEPGAGSDAAMIKTKANKDGDGWRISGSKIWTTNSPHADYVIVFAVTDHEKASRRQGGISTFFIPTTAPGFSVQRVIKMWGSIGGDEAVLIFDGVRAEPHQLVGDLDDGFATAMLGTDLGRLYNTARSVGLARWCLEMGFEYIKQRKTFGRAISEYQGVTFPLAESAMEIHAAHLMGLNVAQLIDKGMNVRKELAMAKSFASRKATKAADRVMQVHGAMGMTNELFLTDAYTALRKINIADGTNEILAHIVVKETLRGKTEL